MKLFLPLILILAVNTSAMTHPSSGNDDSQDAIAVARKLFAAMRSKDALAIRSLFTAEGQLVAVDKPRDGQGISKTRVFTADAFAKLIAEAKGPEFIETMAQPEVRVFGDLALVFGRYSFYVGDKFSHCGTNSFQLVRTVEGWKIANAASTLEFVCVPENQAATSQAVNSETKPSDLFSVKLKKLREDIYVAYRPEPLRYFVEGNVTIIINDQDVVVVDAGGAPLAARNTIAEIRKLTPKPVRYLINTHDHVDHTLGNQEYVKAFPGVEIISHPRTRESLDTDGRKYLADTINNFETREQRRQDLMKRLRAEAKPGYEKVIDYWERYAREDIYTRTEEYRRAVITLPTTTFEQKLTLYRGKRTIELLSLGHGDTPGDVVVYLPQDKLVCSGDMLTEPIPYGFSVRPLEMRATLGKLAELDFETIVPGHGEVLQGKDYLRKVMSLLQSVQDQVQVAVAAGLDLEGTKKKVDLTKFIEEFGQNDPVRAYRFQGWFINPNVAETFKEVKERAAPR